MTQRDFKFKKTPPKILAGGKLLGRKIIFRYALFEI